VRNAVDRVQQRAAQRSPQRPIELQKMKRDPLRRSGPDSGQPLQRIDQ
jgi:hypothetical protein